MTERPQNLGLSRAADRTHNSRRHHRGETRTDDANRAYHGIHRAEHKHRADEAQQRSSRVGRHHVSARHERQSSRW